MATERANSSRFPRSVEVVSQNATLPVAFSANDGADSHHAWDALVREWGKLLPRHIRRRRRRFRRSYPRHTTRKEHLPTGSRTRNLTTEGRKSLQLLLNANKRLNTAYILRESFDQLWDYKSEAWARRFFDNWKAQLRWQRLK